MAEQHARSIHRHTTMTPKPPSVAYEGGGNDFTYLRTIEGHVNYDEENAPESWGVDDFQNAEQCSYDSGEGL